MGAAIGGSLDLGLQLATNGGDISKVNWTSVAVSTATGSLGVGLTSKIASLSLGTASKIALNAAGSAALGAGDRVVRNALEGKCLGDNVLTSALAGGALGAAGEGVSIAAPRVIGSSSGALGGADDAARVADDAVGALDALAPLGGRGGAIPREKIDSFGSHKGIASGRPFFPEEIGLPISPRQLSTDGVRVTNRGVTKVEEHLRRFGPDPQNEAQLQRLRNIAAGKLEPTQADLNNYTHELRESLRYKRLGYGTGQQPSDQDAAYQVWNNLHTATLEDYGLKEGPGVLYHPSTEIPY